jgi:cation:H+ antiporter
LLLILGAEILVRAAVRLAASLKVRPLIIGLTVVAFGSSAPQMTVSLQATLAGNTDIAVGSVIGSSIFNILVTLGLSALIIPLRVSRQLVRLDIPVMILAGLLVFTLAANEELTPVDGLLLLIALLAYLGVLHYQTRHSRRPRTLDTVARAPWLSSVLQMLGGLLILVLAGHLLLGAAVDVAADLGLSERIIGLTLIGVGTSLPCLATSLVAALRGQREIAVGNVIGSNLFNLLGVLGLTALLAPSPLSVSPNALDFDLPVMLGVVVLCLPVFYTGYRVTRAEGLVLLGLYLAYGLHVMSFTTGMPLANKLEQLMLYYVLPVVQHAASLAPPTQEGIAMTDQKKPGVEMRRQVMGDVFVDRALGNATEFTQPLQDFVNEHAWGSVWTREGLPLKTRSLITLAALTALKCPQELKGHVRGALNNGCTVEEIREALLHCAVYAGVPAAIDAFRAAQEVIDTYQKEG